jgi:hypothetical protein
MKPLGATPSTNTLLQALLFLTPYCIPQLHNCNRFLAMHASPSLFFNFGFNPLFGTFPWRSTFLRLPCISGAIYPRSLVDIWIVLPLRAPRILVSHDDRQ